MGSWWKYGFPHTTERTTLCDLEKSVWRKAEQGIFDVVVLVSPMGGEMWIFILMALTLPRGLPQTLPKLNSCFRLAMVCSLRQEIDNKLNSESRPWHPGCPLSPQQLSPLHLPQFFPLGNFSLSSYREDALNVKVAVVSLVKANRAFRFSLFLLKIRTPKSPLADGYSGCFSCCLPIVR